MSTNGYCAAKRKQAYDTYPECTTYAQIFLHICRVDGDILPNTLEWTEVQKRVAAEL